MMESQKKNNRCITTYEKINEKLEKASLIYINSQSENELKEFILKQRKINRDGKKNSLIEIPKDNIKYVLREQYTSKDKVKGEIGTVPIEDQVYEIKNIALLILISNRLSKLYNKKLENQCLAEEKIQMYRKNERDLLVWKHNAISDLIASLYILSKTGGKEYQSFFSYGELKDNINKSAFIIDLPYIGQMSVHFGPEKLNIIEEARNKAMSILERKRELGQIDKADLKRLREELSVSKILPKYEGKLYEYVSTLPIEYIGPNTKEKIKEIELDTKLPEEIEREDIKRMIESGLNEREAYYLAIKLGCPKRQLKEIIKVYSEEEIEIKNQNETSVGRKAVKMTTAEEREKLVQIENRNLRNYRENKSDKTIGE